MGRESMLGCKKYLHKRHNGVRDARILLASQYVARRQVAMTIQQDHDSFSHNGGILPATSPSQNYLAGYRYCKFLSVFKINAKIYYQFVICL